MLFHVRHLRLVPAPLTLCLLDYFLTLFGQPEVYWRGDVAAVEELSPEVRRLLAISVLASAAGLALWVAVITGLLTLLPRSGALFVAAAVTMGHTVGATTWLWRWPAGGYQAGVGLCVLSAFLFVAGVRWEEARAPLENHSDRWGRVRWPLVGVLAAVPVFAFLWPQ